MHIPIAVESNDWHLTRQNRKAVIELIEEKCKLATKLGVKYLFVLGDIFDSRQEQPLDNLKAFEEILEIITRYNLRSIFIPGNHDKTDYSSENSFLDAYQYWPGVTIVRDYMTMTISGLEINFLPFFEDALLWDKIRFAKTLMSKGSKQILCSHFALTGSINNDGKPVQSIITSDLLKIFHRVYLGHYHNTQEVTSSIIHLPSLMQRNFGEDPNKGFTVIYDDGTYSIVNSQFKKFHTVKLNLDELSATEIREIILDLDPAAENVRLKISGNDTKKKAFNIEELKQLGFDVKLNNKEIDTSIQEAEEDVIPEFTADSIMEEFLEFSTEEGFEDFEIGQLYLHKTLRHE